MSSAIAVPAQSPAERERRDVLSLGQSPPAAASGHSPGKVLDLRLWLAARAHVAAWLGCYRAANGSSRELLALRRIDGGTLVIDCEARSYSDARLVACIAADEPPENSRIVCELYLADDSRGCCRALSPEDLEPLVTGFVAATRADGSSRSVHFGDRVYRIRALRGDSGFPMLGWTSDTAVAGPRGPDFDRVTLRGVIAILENYEPPRTITQQTLATLGEHNAVSTSDLRGQLERVLHSPIVLNRGLREAVDRALTAGATMSEIAIRCGRVKRDRRGVESGETSWLARRVGRLPEAGGHEPTRWIHSRTLALIAREGLGLNPNEVEL